MPRTITARTIYIKPYGKVLRTTFGGTFEVPGFAVYVNGRRLEISPRTEEQAEKIAADLRGESKCEHDWVKIGTGFYVCRKCGGRRITEGPWKPRR